MEFLHVSIALLASMILVLAGMVGWLYWQQSRLFQNMNSIVMIIGEMARPPEPMPVSEPEVQVQQDDDRVSVHPEPEEETAVVVSDLETDGLESKTKKELKEILTKRGIPFGPKDDKNALISLLKATA
jgi:hypothetical protein